VAATLNGDGLLRVRRLCRPKRNREACTARPGPARSPWVATRSASDCRRRRRGPKVRPRRERLTDMRERDRGQFVFYCQL